jgi:predicted metalloprotease with PDZ domain
MKLSRIRPLLFLVLPLALAAPRARALDAISLTVDASGTQQKLLHARMEIPVAPGELTLYYPKWIPGEHGATGPISDIVNLHFEGGGKTVPWKRDLLDVFTFHLEIPQGVNRLTASYDYIEPEGYSATDKLMVLEWNDVLLYPAGTPAEQLTYDATLRLPEGWKFGTALPIEKQSGDEIRFKPISLDHLVDSPVIAGQYYRAIDITPPGEPIHHELDMAADSEEALNISPENQKEMVNLVAESGKLFGARHYRDYHFLFALSDHVAHFGLEHHESTGGRLVCAAPDPPCAARLEPSTAWV